MEKLKSYLVDWTEHYYKNRDLMVRKIQSIEKNKDKIDLLITYKDTVNAVIVEPFLNNVLEIIDRLKPFKGKKLTFVTYNTKDNLKTITGNWEHLAKFDHSFNIFFVNPFSSTDTKWIIFPQTHNSISEGKFESGLKALFETVEPITKEELEKNVK